MAFAQAAAARRPIAGAVATLGVSDRVTFLRKTYAHLGISLIAFAALTGALIRYAPEVSWTLSKPFLGGGGFLGLMLAFAGIIAVFMISRRLAVSQTSHGKQYLGLALFVAMYSWLLQPLIWVLMFKFSTFSVEDIAAIRAGHVVPALNGHALAILMQAVVITMSIFIGLTLVVFLTRKDFTFLRGALAIGSFMVFGVILASWLFGFSLGALFCGFVILLLGGYILFQTSTIMKEFPPSAYVAAALMLFSSIVTLFMYVLQLLMSVNNNNR